MASSSGLIGFKNDPFFDMEDNIQQLLSNYDILLIYGQWNVCLCTMMTELQWKKDFVIVSNQIWLSEVRDH
jgi:hypothetical protein